MLSEEEKKAIDKLSSKKNETTWNDTIRQIKREEITDVVVTRQKYIKILLNLIEKQNKIIDKMADEIYDLGQKQDMRNDDITIWIDKEHILNYFTNKE